MTGHRQVKQAALFYEFSLDEHIPADHLVRSIDRFVELGDLRRELPVLYSRIGRRSIDPELMIGMLLTGYCFGIPLSGGFVRRSTSTLLIDGSANSGSTAQCPIIRRFLRTGTAAFARAICFAACSRAVSVVR
jgi:transposase